MDEHRKYGINVKVYDPPRPGGLDKLSESEAHAVWEDVTESFWFSLENTVQGDNLADHVYAEGRMGGWAVPSPSIDPEDDAAKFQKFKELVEAEYDYYLDEVWPEAVELAVRDKEVEARDPMLTFQLRRSAAATVAGLVGTEDQIDNIVHFEDGDPRSAVTAADEAWEELREVFPVEIFAEHGEWIGKDEEEA